MLEDALRSAGRTSVESKPLDSSKSRPKGAGKGTLQTPSSAVKATSAAEPSKRPQFPPAPLTKSKICFAHDPASDKKRTTQGCAYEHLDTRKPELAKRFKAAKVAFDSRPRSGR